MTRKKISVWLSAFRLRTLPLALSSIGMGSFLAASQGYFKWTIFFYSVLTTVFLQILSNIANDYGDYQNGADGLDRIGPERAMQTGVISPKSMKTAIVVFILLSLLSGIKLLLISFSFNFQFLAFFFLGLFAILAAIKYTAGKNPYGYKGLGDVSVFLFFGIVGVSGSYYLYAKNLPLMMLFPSSTLGFFSAAVLNINNIRDIESDAKAGKISIPVKIGLKNAKIYHLVLLLSGTINVMFFSILNYKEPVHLLYVLVIPLVILNGYKIYTLKPDKMDPYLKQMAITTLLFVLTFGIGMLG